jgi:Ca2+-binding EF-hand superfamily protein
MNSDKSNAIMNKLKLFLHRRWDATNSQMGDSNNVYRTFRLIDTDNNDVVSKEEFIYGINKISGQVITRSDSSIIYDIIDKDDNNRLTYKEFLRGLHKEMSPVRFTLINNIFNSIDKNKSGYFTAADLDYSSHPDVISGKSSPRMMAVKYMKLFLGDYNQCDKRQVRRKEFIDYYTDLSMSIASDAYFISVVINAYNCSATWRRTKTDTV